MPLQVKVRALCARSAPPTMAFHAIEKCSGAVRSGWALHLGVRAGHPKESKNPARIRDLCCD